MTILESTKDSAEKLPKVMMVTPFSDADRGVGNLYIASLTSDYPESRLIKCTNCLHLRANSASKTIEKYRDKLLVKIATFPVLSDIRLWFIKRYRLPPEMARIEKLAEDQKVDVIWSPLNSCESIFLIGGVIKNMHAPIVSIVWDVPEYLARNANLSSRSRKFLLNTFSDILSKSHAVIVMSENMRERYAGAYQANAHVLPYCPATTALPIKTIREEGKDVATMVFTGSLYACSEWNALLDFLESCDQIVNGVKIRLKFIGGHSARVRKRRWVEYYSNMPEASVVTEIGNADIAYLPYWMQQSHSLFAETAFPSKLPFYLSAGVPVLFHGPANAAAAGFIRANPAIGVNSCSTSHSELRCAIERLLSRSFVQQFQSSVEKVYSDSFSIHKARNTFHTLSLQSHAKISKLQ